MTKNLIQKILQGDQEACSQWVEEHQEVVFRLAYLILGDADDAKDAAQEAFIRAIRALHTYDPSRPMRPWLLSITSNVARTHIQAHSRHLAALKRFHQQEIIHFKHHDAEHIWQAVQELALLDREIIYLRFFLGLPVAEAAGALQIPIGTVKSRQYRALQHLRALLQEEA